jgi:UDP-N-acetylglucosamine--N-acetylmuramyl-(pentapeptide) pyrophosphoryl-undecaprenol N-acetylglucosamine transferase
LAEPAKVAVIAAGGTGGHLFPAQALAERLKERGWRIILATDGRTEALAADFPAERRVAIASATIRGNPAAMLGAVLAILRGFLQARGLLSKTGASVVVGFGGYPSLPTVFAAATQGRRTVIHEQNAVLGRANRLLAPFVTAVACAFPTLLKASPKVRDGAIVVGTPVRPDIRTLIDVAYDAPAPDGPVRLLVTGGSQGARLLSELVPAAVAALPETLRLRLEVWQQARSESLDLARRLYADALVKAEVAPFFRDMASRLGAAHLVIGRAGASTVGEIAIAGRPSILAPLKIALDDDQGQNAKLLSETGSAVVVREDELTQPGLTQLLETLLGDPAKLSQMAAAARRTATPNAAESLADLVERVAR